MLRVPRFGTFSELSVVNNTFTATPMRPAAVIDGSAPVGVATNLMH